MSLLQMPPELKLNFIERLDPESSLCFALTNRQHSELCQDVLQEHRLFARYSSVGATSPGPTLWSTLREILQDPRKAWYVRELNLTNDLDSIEMEPVSEEDLNLHKAAAQELVPLYSYQRTFFAAEPDDNRDLFGDLDNLIDAHAEDIASILLLYHLPQLRTFRMTVKCTSDGYLDMFMRRVAAGYQDPVLATRMPLQHLRVAAIAHHDTEGSCNVDWAVYFLCVPSLRYFAGLSMGSEGIMNGTNTEAYLRTVTGAPVSNVEEIEFDNCRFDAQSLHVILPLLRNLKRFSYQAGGHTVSFSDYEPRRVFEALTTHVAHSLEELELLNCETGFMEFRENDLPFTSLRGFEKLKALHCETRWVLRSQDTDLGDDEALSQGFHSAGDAGEAITDPRDNLPESLEELYLYGIYEDEEWEQLIELFRAPNVSTPRLTFEKTRLMRESTAWDRPGTQEKFGGAPEPDGRFGNPLHTQIWVGHGY